MKYEWAAIWERTSIEQTKDGENEILKRIKRAGTIHDDHGQNVAVSVVNLETGNLVFLEIRSA